MRSNKVDVNYQDAYGKTALISAADKGYRDVIGLLIESGPNLDLQDENGNTALISAAKIERVTLLICSLKMELTSIFRTKTAKLL